MNEARISIIRRMLAVGEPFRWSAKRKQKKRGEMAPTVALANTLTGPVNDLLEEHHREYLLRYRVGLSELKQNRLFKTIRPNSKSASTCLPLAQHIISQRSFHDNAWRSIQIQEIRSMEIKLYAIISFFPSSYLSVGRNIGLGKRVIAAD